MNGEAEFETSSEEIYLRHNSDNSSGYHQSLHVMDTKLKKLNSMV
jgi:hypothetical protein